MSDIEKVKKLRESSDNLVVGSMKNRPGLASSDLGPYASELIEYHQRNGLSYLKREDKLNALKCFLNACCKLCDVKPVKPEIRQQVACEVHISAQTMDLSPNDPSNEDPMET